MTAATSASPENTPLESLARITRNRSLLILSVLVVVLIISNVWIYSTFQDQVNNLSSEKTSLQSQITNLTDIVNLDRSTVIINNQTVGQAAGAYTSWTFSAQYAGYLTVNVHSSTTTNTYVHVLYNSFSVVFDQTILVGAGGKAVFPILPCNDIEVRVGNTNTLNSAIERATITYFY